MAYFTFDGMRIFYRDQGEGRPPLIVPGNTASSAVHLGELEHFARTHHSVAVDLPGTGRSDRMAEWPEDWWRYGGRCVAALIDHLGEGPAILVGTSGGAITALHTAIDSPKSVRAVVADSCVARQPPATIEVELAKRARAGPDLAHFWAHAHGADWRAVIDADSALMRRHAACDGRWFGEELTAMLCPVLFTGSMRDAVLHNGPEQMSNMAEHIPDSEVYLVNGGDHPLMWTRPEAFRGSVAAFLDRTVSGNDGSRSTARRRR